MKRLSIAISLVVLIGVTSLQLIRPHYIFNLNLRRPHSFFFATGDSGFAAGRYMQLYDKPIGLSVNAQFNQDICAIWRYGRLATQPARAVTFLGLGYLKYDVPLLSMHGQSTLTEHSLIVPYWFIICVAAGYLQKPLRTRLLARRRKNRSLCPACGYDLRATPDRCPECGAIPSPPDHQTPRESAAARPAST
jgi:hypothetical protein